MKGHAASVSDSSEPECKKQPRKYVQIVVTLPEAYLPGSAWAARTSRARSTRRSRWTTCRSRPPHDLAQPRLRGVLPLHDHADVDRLGRPARDDRFAGKPNPAADGDLPDHAQRDGAACSTPRARTSRPGSPPTCGASATGPAPICRPDRRPHLGRRRQLRRPAERRRRLRGIGHHVEHRDGADRPDPLTRAAREHDQVGT
jgi:hypothetical protein